MGHMRASKQSFLYQVKIHQMNQYLLKKTKGRLER